MFSLLFNMMIKHQIKGMMWEMILTDCTIKLRRSKTYSCEDFACSTRCCIISLLIIATTRAEGPRDCVREEPQHMSVHLLHALHSWRSELCMKETVSPSVLLALEFHIFRLSNVNLKQEDNTWWQSVGNIYAFTVATRRACRAVQEENHSHHCQPLPVYQNQDTGTADWF